MKDNQPFYKKKIGHCLAQPGSEKTDFAPLCLRNKQFAVYEDLVTGASTGRLVATESGPFRLGRNTLGGLYPPLKEDSCAKAWIDGEYAVTK